METVSVSRTISGPESAVRDAILDVEPFMLSAGFDEVTVDGDEIHLVNRVGIAQLELALRRIEEPDAVLAYEQAEGIFESMRTVYRIEDAGEAGVRVEAETDFSLDVALVGDLLDATVIKRQRRRELDAQFDHLESLFA
ncbi:SRPBCC family protein [Haloplanus rallus]|uniref:SRPBCC family protein n=1 Tax=Haloplanus rallus TaxID=1816183 RepID=A0A6B9F722_9EURY|nr:MULTISPECIES: SRPBCC family protein [Haloplanus]QGX94154.1 SRPBCC family protein [Haloplanus rallus]